MTAGAELRLLFLLALAVGCGETSRSSKPLGTPSDDATGGERPRPAEPPTWDGQRPATFDAGEDATVTTKVRVDCDLESPAWVFYHDLSKCDCETVTEDCLCKGVSKECFCETAYCPSYEEALAAVGCSSQSEQLLRHVSGCGLISLEGYGAEFVRYYYAYDAVTLELVGAHAGTDTTCGQYRWGATIDDCDEELTVEPMCDVRECE